MNFGIEKNQGIRLNEQQERDVTELYFGSPSIMMSRNSFMSMVIDCPPRVVLKNHPDISESPMMADMMAEHYLPIAHKIYDWIKLKGVYPWYYKKIRNTGMTKPVIPELNSGYITTHLNKDHEQVFKWFWYGERKHYSRMKFRTKKPNSQPDIHGNLRSDIYSAIAEYKTIKIVRESTEIASYHQARIQHIFEHKPPRNAPGDDNLTTLESFSDEIAGIVQRRQEGLRAKKMTLRTDSARLGVLEAISRNQHVKMRFGSHPVLRSEDRGTQWERQNANLLDSAIPLQPDFVYKPAAVPKISVDLEPMSKRFDISLAATMEFPRQLIETSGNRNVNDSSKQFLNARIKDWNHFITKEFKNIFMTIHEQDLEAGFAPVVKARRERDDYQSIHINDEVEIVMPCSTIAEYDDLKKMYMDGIMDKQTFGEHAYSIFGLSTEDMTLQEYPDKFPRELYNPQLAKMKPMEK